MGGFAYMAGLGTAFLTGMHGFGFLFAWFLTVYALLGCLRFAIPPRLQIELPVEFHRQLG
jgi:hypothetical protein